jgi:hypothetical protein
MSFSVRGSAQTINTKNYKQSLWGKFWRDNEGKVVIFQWPNIWLVIWVICEFIAILSSSKSIYNVTWWVGTVALAIWALLEIVKGVNYFRRLLGFLVALLIVISIFNIGL